MADPLQLREDDLLNQIRVMYGMGASGQSQEQLTLSGNDIERQLAGLGPEPVKFSRYGRGATVTRGRPTSTWNQWNSARNSLTQQQVDLNKRIAGGVSGNQGMLDKSTRNRQSINSLFQTTRRAAVDEGTHELDDRYTSTMRLHRARNANGGMGGSSMDASTRRRALTDLFRGRQSIQNSASQAETSGRNSLDDRRMELERQVKLGTSPDVGTINALDQASSDVNSAYRDLPQLALGTLLTGTGDVYRDTTQAGAYGRQGGSAFYRPRSTASRSGSYSGGG